MSEISQRLASLSPQKRRLLEQRLKKKPTVGEPIAIVGMGCRFPGAASLDQYWQVIEQCRTTTGEIPLSRWDLEEFYDPTGELRGKMSVRWGGFVDDVDQFDPLFFGISPREAAKMDPQQRLLLEVAWEALEHANLPADQLSGTATGVFVGIGGTDYTKLAVPCDDYFEQIDAHSGTGNALSIAANRLSYLLDLRGPSMSVDTACSSALVGLHLAVRSLRSRECDAAIAAGVNLILSPETTIAFSKARMLSPDGVCRPFDAGANGYVRGEGCGAVVLKRLTDAVNAGDRVLAVLRATAINQDGRTSGITAPNAGSQQAVIRTALAQAGLTAGEIGYVEAHGTGTPLGDPVEFEALSKVFQARSPNAAPCFLGSVKANIGHLETASGIAGLIKVVLMLQRQRILPQTHLEAINPIISLTGTRLQIPTEATEWRPIAGTRLAGVSSFGFGGANAHVIVESAPAPKTKPVKNERPLHLLTLSAKSEAALDELSQKYRQALDESQASFPDLAFTANTGRSHFNHRLTLIAADTEQLAAQLDARVDGKRAAGMKSGQVQLAARPKLAMLFTGQGSQRLDMGRRLLETQPTFRRAMEQCDEILRDSIGRSLLEILYPKDRNGSHRNGSTASHPMTNGSNGKHTAPPAAGTPPIDETAFTQPALFALEYSLATLWRSWGVEPSLVGGHSVGEYAAACMAGVFSLEDGLRLIAERARLMQSLPHDGLMAVVFAPLGRVAEAIAGREDDVSIAAANGPENTVISGVDRAVRELVAQFESAGVGTQMLTVSHAFHSPLMEPILDEFEQFAEQFEYHAPSIPLISNLSGEINTSAAPTARYWRDHIRSAVRFADGMQQLAEQQPHAVLEVGPAASLLGMGRRCLSELSTAWLPSLRKGQDDWQVMLSSLAELHLLGFSVDWRGFDGDWPRRRVELPTYPFQRTSHWLEGIPTSKCRTASAGRGPLLHPLLGSQVASPLSTRLYESLVSGHSPRYLIDHQVQGSPVMPAAAYLEMALAAATHVDGNAATTLENISIQQAMFLPDEGNRRLQVTVSPESSGQRTFEAYSSPGGDDKPSWTLHACGKLRLADAQSDRPAAIDLDALQAQLGEPGQRDDFYEMMRTRGLAYGPAFQVLAGMQMGAGEALAEVQLPGSVQKESDKHHLHPALGDALFQTMAGVVPPQADGSPSPFTYMPVGVERVRVYEKPSGEMHTLARRTSDDSNPSPEAVKGDVLLLGADGRVLVELSGVEIKRVGRAPGEAHEADIRDWLYQIEWRAEPLPVAETSATESPGEETNQSEPSAPSATWVVFSDDQLGPELAAQIERRGEQCVLVSPNEVEGEPGDDPHTIDPLSGEDYQSLLGHTFSDPSSRCAGVIHLWSLRGPDCDESPDAALDAARRLGCGSVLRLLQSLSRADLAKTPALWLVTQGAHAIGDEAATSPGQTALWGLGRVAAMEHPELQCRLVDLDVTSSPAEAAELLSQEIAAADEENQIAYRGGARHVARLAAAPHALEGETATAVDGHLLAPADTPFRLRLATAGSFDSLWYESCSRRTPEAGQVEFAVHAAGLNFSDVLKAMGLYPGLTDDIVPLGIEASGVVTAVGEGVTRFKPGDEVFGVAPYGFASHAISAEYAIVAKPNSISHRQAATIPITFLTAYYALVRLAQLQPGERVLIHAGAGGVGLAAIQIAQKIGAEVFATAGSDEKRDYLRSLGVEHVMNSRTLDFADEIRKSTARGGVDVVLNSLPGDAVTASLDVMAAYGRFLEIGKTDIYQNRMLGLLPFQDNLSYFAIDLDRMFRQRGEYILGLFAELMTHFERGEYRPLESTEFDVPETIDAFRYMAQRKNIGKVVVSLESHWANRDPLADDNTSAGLAENSDGDADSEAAPIRSDATYLITGGLGALGLELAGWLVGRGATHLALLSRRGADEATKARLGALRENGARVAVLQGDVSLADSLQAALASIPADYPALRGVIHAAGVLDDGLLYDMTLERLDKALAPKQVGGWNLHSATRDVPLDFFAMFSSAASVLGSPGQGNYAAGNAYLDGLAQHRRSQGLPAVSINWGPWAAAGMAAALNEQGQMQSRGLEPIATQKGLEVFGEILRSTSTNVSVMDARWDNLFEAMSSRRPPLLRDFEAQQTQSASNESKVNQAFLDELASVGQDDRENLLRSYFTDELARIMGVDPEQIEPEQPLSTLGLDSLLAMELKNNLETQLAFSLPMAKFMEGPTIASLAAHAATAIVGDADAPVAIAGSSSAAKDWSPLVTLQREGAEPPLFCIHPAGGDVRCYYDLGRAVRDRPVYALRARGMEGVHPPHTSVAELARDYAQAIRGMQPAGPYHLVGWSTGGIFAHAIAEALAADEQHCKLVLIDTPLPEILQRADLNDESRFLYDLVNFANSFSGKSMSTTYEQLRKLESSERFELALREAKQHQVLPPDASVEFVQRLVEVCQAHVKAIREYTLAPLEQSISLVRPAEKEFLAEASGQTVRGDLGWGDLGAARLTMHEVAGDHFSMMTGENVCALVELLSREVFEAPTA